MGKIWIDNLRKKLMYSVGTKEYEVMSDEYNNIRIENITEVPSKGLLPNVFYQFGFITDTVKILFAQGTNRAILWEYRGEFTLKEGGNIIFPSNVTWSYPVNPKFTPEHTYQFRITNLIGTILER